MERTWFSRQDMINDQDTGIFCEVTELITMFELNKADTLPPNLISWICSGSGLSWLPTLSIGLKTLVCDNNDLTSLPSLPSSLESLFCYRNKLTRLPDLPTGLRELICHNNKLTVLPEINNNLVFLSCYSNRLKKLPKISNNLCFIQCYDNLFNIGRIVYNNVKTKTNDQDFTTFIKINKTEIDKFTNLVNNGLFNYVSQYSDFMDKIK